MTANCRQVVLSELAQEQLLAIPSDAAYLHVKEAIRNLSLFPQMGRVYEPDYEAAVPPVTCRILYAGRYGVYYTGPDGDSPAAPLVVLAVEDERADPKRRFSGMRA